MNDPIRIIEPDAGLGKISELDALGVNFTPIALAACECGCLVCVDLQTPNCDRLRNPDQLRRSQFATPAPHGVKKNGTLIPTVICIDLHGPNLACRLI